MLGAQILHPGLQAGHNKTFEQEGLPYGLLKRFSSKNNEMEEKGGVGSDSPAAAGKLMMARLMTSVEARFSTSQINQTSSLNPVASTQEVDDFSPEAVSSRILGFVKDRLQQEKANGASDERIEQLFNQAKEGIEKGFAEARHMIAEQGVFTDEVKDNFFTTVSLTQKGMDQLEEDLFSSNEQVPLTSIAGSNAGSGNLTAASRELYYNQQRSFDMQIKTQDGDIVTVKVSGGESFSTSEFSATDNNTSVSGFESSYSNHSHFSFSVEGELDDGELAALNDLFSQVNDIADDFYAGDVEAAFNQALDVGYDADELAGFAVNMRRSEVVAVRETYAEVAGYGLPEATSVNPLQAMMDKLADFSEKVKQAHAYLLDGAGDQVFSQLLKELVPAHENPAASGPDEADDSKQAFDDFVEAVLS